VNTDPVRSKLEAAMTTADLADSTSAVVMTKIRVPRRRPDLVSRRRLVDFIHTHLDRKLILISAPAGYGKTSLLADFAYEIDLPVCWYTLDAFDRDLRVFLEHLVAAIARQFPAFGERSRSALQQTADLGRNLYPLVTTLVREIYDTIPQYFILILDDYHTVEVQDKIAEFLDLFETYVDENCHLILASRTLPALPSLSLLVARQQVAGLSIDELRFTPAEIQTLAHQNYGLELIPQQAQELAGQTEGWITGILLTATPRWRQEQPVKLQGQVNVGLYDYLSKQVLDQQPAPLRDFLLGSSVLDELSPDLCAAVLGLEQAADLMDQLRVRSLFVTEFQGEDNRLRYHDLFRGFLQTGLRRQSEARFRELMLRAAETYASLGRWEQAVSRYLVLQEYEAVVEIVERMATELFGAGRWDTLASWIDALPETLQAAHPHVLVQRAKLHAERGEHTPALALYNQAIQAFTATDDLPWVAYSLAQKGTVLRFQGRYIEAITLFEEALSLVNRTCKSSEQATAREKFTMASAHRNMGLCQFSLGRLAEGQAALQQALRLYEELDAACDIGLVHHDLGLGHELAGDLEEATSHYLAALQRWQQLGNPGPWANTLNSLGVIHYLQGNYDQAQRLLSEALSKVQQANNLRVEALVRASLGDLYRDLGAYEQARQAYADGLLIATSTGEGFVVTYALDGLGNTFRLQGNLAQAKELLREAMQLAEQHGSTYETGLCHTSLGILAFEEGDPATAERHLSQAVEQFESGGFKRELARACLHRAWVTFQAGQLDSASADLDRTCALADQLGFDEFLVVDSQRLQPLLRYALEKGINPALSHWLERAKVHPSQMALVTEPAARIEPVSLKVYALGKPRVEMKGDDVQWATLRSRDLFFCLLQNTPGLSKEEIGTIFWPEHPPHKLDGIFRSTVYRLRRALFRECVILEGNLYRFDRKSAYWFDVEVFENLLNQAGQPQTTPQEKKILLEDALALYQGDYLEGIYADWCAMERERLRERYLAALETLADLCAEREELQRAMEVYQVILAKDEYHEPAHRGLMRCYYRLGDRAAAIRQYQICVKTLREGLGLTPMPEIEELYQQITS